MESTNKPSSLLSNAIQKLWNRCRSTQTICSRGRLTGRIIQNRRVRKALTVETLVQKRAMVSALLDAFFIEGLLSTRPATLPQFTISFRLRSRLAQLLNLNPSTARELERFVDTSTSAPMHLLCLSVFVALRMGLSLWRDRTSQFVWQLET